MADSLPLNLLYEIFTHLPQQDLLLVQRVCRTWHEIIKSSNSLQALLFLRPDPTSSFLPRVLNDEASQAVQLNPLLQWRFPGFFDGDRYDSHHMSDHHNLGPWVSAYWVRGQSRAKLPRLDRRRMAVFARPEASWRRMIPCWPAPESLQVSFGHRVGGRLRVLNFSNESEQTRGDADEGMPSWLTFGVLYDIVEQAWFCGIPERVRYAKFDWSFGGRPPIEPRPRAIMEDLEGPIRDALPQKRIGGPGCVLVHLNNDAWCGTNFSGRSKRRSKGREYEREFESEGSIMTKLKWDEIIAFTFIRRF